MVDVKTIEELKTFPVAVILREIKKVSNREQFEVSQLKEWLDNTEGDSLNEKLYVLLHGRKLCLVCGAKTKFERIDRGFSETCGRKCAGVIAKPKREATMLERYGGTTTLTSDKLKSKAQSTNLERYGGKSPMSSKMIQEKAQSTNVERYGGKSPMLSAEVSALAGSRKHHRSAKKNLDYAINELGLKLISGEFQKRDGLTDWECSAGHEIKEHRYTQYPYPIRCKTCHPLLSGTSLMEQDLALWISTITEIKTNFKIPSSNGVEVDILVGDIGIEFNGLYWHSELVGKTKNYHADKRLLCQERNIKLIQFFEHEWLFKTEIVKSMILHRLHKSPIKIAARKLQVCEIAKSTATKFMEDNHINGHANFKFAYGLIDLNGELQACATFAKDRFSHESKKIELIRFCTKINTSVVGGLSKILNFFDLKNENTILKTFCDLRFGDGAGYLASGWEYVKTTPPGYWYFNRQKEVFHRLNFTRMKLINILGDGASGTEWELAQQLGLNRFWDCGHLVFERKN